MNITFKKSVYHFYTSSKAMIRPMRRLLFSGYIIIRMVNKIQYPVIEIKSQHTFQKAENLNNTH